MSTLLCKSYYLYEIFTAAFFLVSEFNVKIQEFNLTSCFFINYFVRQFSVSAGKPIPLKLCARAYNKYKSAVIDLCDFITIFRNRSTN